MVIKRNDAFPSFSSKFIKNPPISWNIIQVEKKIKYTKYVAYNMYDRDEAMPHYYYATALEYLIKRAQEEGKQIPAYIYETPQYGKEKYDMRHPLLKQKPKR